MPGREPREAPTRDDVLAGSSEIVAGIFGLLRVKGSALPTPQRNARMLIAVSSIAGGVGQARGVKTLLGLKVTGYLAAFALVLVDKRRRRT